MKLFTLCLALTLCTLPCLCRAAKETTDSGASSGAASGATSASTDTTDTAGAKLQNAKPKRDAALVLGGGGYHGPSNKYLPPALGSNYDSYALAHGNGLAVSSGFGDFGSLFDVNNHHHHHHHQNLQHHQHHHQHQQPFVSSHRQQHHHESSAGVGVGILGGGGGGGGGGVGVGYAHSGFGAGADGAYHAPSKVETYIVQSEHGGHGVHANHILHGGLQSGGYKYVAPATNYIGHSTAGGLSHQHSPHYHTSHLHASNTGGAALGQRLHTTYVVSSQQHQHQHQHHADASQQLHQPQTIYVHKPVSSVQQQQHQQQVFDLTAGHHGHHHDQHVHHGSGVHYAPAPAPAPALAPVYVAHGAAGHAGIDGVHLGAAALGYNYDISPASFAGGSHKPALAISYGLPSASSHVHHHDDTTPAYALGHKGLGHFSYAASKPQALNTEIIGSSSANSASSDQAHAHAQAHLNAHSLAEISKAPFKPSAFLGAKIENNIVSHAGGGAGGGGGDGGYDAPATHYLPPTSVGYEFQAPPSLLYGAPAHAGDAATHVLEPEGSYLPPTPPSSSYGVPAQH